MDPEEVWWRAAFSVYKSRAPGGWCDCPLRELGANQHLVREVLLVGVIPLYCASTNEINPQEGGEPISRHCVFEVSS
jgi:hypothetical protein